MRMKAEMAFYEITVLLLMLPFGSDGTAVPAAGQVSFASSGDVILGATFPFHSWSTTPCGGKLSRWAIELLETFIYAIDEINGRDDLLANVTIGYDIRDDCYSEIAAMWSALSLASTSERNQTYIEFKEVSTPESGTLIGIVGTVSSSTSIPAAQAAYIYHVPIISPFATSNELSDKSRFPNFLRTVPPDKLQASAIVDILLRFNWRYIGLYFDFSSYGIHGAQEIQKMAVKQDICLAFSVPVKSNAPQTELDEAVQKVKTFQKLEVVVMFTSGDVAGAIISNINKEFKNHSITFIASDAWGYFDTLEKYGVDLESVRGSIFLRLKYHNIPGFEEYFRHLERFPNVSQVSPWFKDFRMEWMRGKSCSHLKDCPIPLNSNDNFVVDAVLAYAYALQNLLADLCANDTCAKTLQTVTGNDLLPYLMKVEFEGIAGHYRFDSSGDPRGKFRILNLQRDTSGKFEFVEIGEWDRAEEEPLRLNTPVVQWVGDQPPTSLCRDVCLSGSIEIPLEEKCCFGCQRCPKNAIVANKSMCQECPKELWPDDTFRRCFPIIPTPPDWNDPVVVVIIVLSFIGLVLSALAAAGLYFYRKHILIKASSRELSSINILGLALAFICPFLLLLPPTYVSCLSSEIVVSLCITLTYTPTLLKVNRIHRIFEAGKKSNKRPRFIGPRVQIVFVLVAVIITIVIGFIGALTSPSTPEKLYFVPPTGYIETFCKFGYGFLVSTIYNLLLILACCYFAFKARRVPSNYNESKFIALSVYSTLVFGMAAVPVYITAVYTLQKVATFCLALILNAFLTLVCVYLPKLYAIRFDVQVELCEWKTTTSVSAVVASTVPTSQQRNLVNPTAGPGSSATGM